MSDTPLRRLPLVTLYLTERCNSRCVSCDYWRHGHRDLNLLAVERLLPGLAQLQTRTVLLSGGEPLLNPEWAEIAGLLKARGLSVWLLTSGLSLAKHAVRVASLFDAVTVSLDGSIPATYAAVRGLDAFDKVCEGVRAAAAAGANVGLRVTVQRANFLEMPALVRLALKLGTRQISFLAVDTSSAHAFGRAGGFASDLGLTAEDLPVFAGVLRELELEHGAEFRSGFIAESPQKLQRLLQYFVAGCGSGDYPPVHCNAPEFSAVIDAAGRVRPCFFIPGPPEAHARDGLATALSGRAMMRLRSTIRQQQRPECGRCVCSMWRDPAGFADTAFPLPVAGLY